MELAMSLTEWVSWNDLEPVMLISLDQHHEDIAKLKEENKSHVC